MRESLTDKRLLTQRVAMNCRGRKRKDSRLFFRELKMPLAKCFTNDQMKKYQGWSTPRDFLRVLNNEFSFNDDPCPPGGIFGLEREWGSRTFCNPPWGYKVGEWISKAVEEAKKKKLIVMLLPSKTDTRWFHDIILKEKAEIRWIKGRLIFEDQRTGRSKYPCPFPCMLVIFDGR
jgi:hypothetical protein